MQVTKVCMHPLKQDRVYISCRMEHCADIRSDFYTDLFLPYRYCGISVYQTKAPIVYIDAKRSIDFEYVSRVLDLLRFIDTVS